MKVKTERTISETLSELSRLSKEATPGEWSGCRGGYCKCGYVFEQFCSPLVGPWHCARLLAMWQIGEPNLSNWKLDTVAAHFGLARESELHGSLEDAVLAGRIFSLLTNSDQLAGSVKEGAA